MADHKDSRSPSPDRSPRRRSPSPRRRSPDSRSPSPRRDRSPAYRRSRSPVTGANTGNCLHFSGLNVQTSENDLEQLCSQYGKVMSIKLIKDPRTNESRGFAFVTMETSEAADAIIEKLDGRELDRRKLSVQRSRRQDPRQATPGAYLGYSRPRPGFYPSRRPYNDYGGGRRYDDRRYDRRDYHDRDDRYRSPPRYRSRSRSPHRHRSRSR